MHKMKKDNILIEIEKKDIEQAEKIGFKLYYGYLLPNAEVDFKE